MTLDRIGAKLDQGNGDLAVQLGPLVAKKGARWPRPGSVRV